MLNYSNFNLMNCYLLEFWAVSHLQCNLHMEKNVNRLVWNEINFLKQYTLIFCCSEWKSKNPQWLEMRLSWRCARKVQNKAENRVNVLPLHQRYAIWVFFAASQTHTYTHKMCFSFGISKKSEKSFSSKNSARGIDEFLEISLESHFILNAKHQF